MAGDGVNKCIDRMCIHKDYLLLRRLNDVITEPIRRARDLSSRYVLCLCHVTSLPKTQIQHKITNQLSLSNILRKSNSE